MALDRRVSYCCLSACRPRTDAVNAAIGSAGIRCLSFDTSDSDSYAARLPNSLGTPPERRSAHLSPPRPRYRLRRGRPHADRHVSARRGTTLDP
jgi:hypothetical protein